jgi:murein L,D-transpeptidase YafK
VLNITDLLIIILICLNIICLMLGYLIGKLNNNQMTIFDNQYLKDNNLNMKNSSQTKINIDSSKIVLPINTENLEKKYTSLGETKNSQENIEGSINKLKNMKGS